MLGDDSVYSHMKCRVVFVLHLKVVSINGADCVEAQRMQRRPMTDICGEASSALEGSERIGRVLPAPR